MSTYQAVITTLPLCNQFAGAEKFNRDYRSLKVEGILVLLRHGVSLRSQETEMGTCQVRETNRRTGGFWPGCIFQLHTS